MPFKLQVATERRPKVVAAALRERSFNWFLFFFPFNSTEYVKVKIVYLILKLGLLFGQDEGHFILELFTN